MNTLRIGSPPIAFSEFTMQSLINEAPRMLDVPPLQWVLLVLSVFFCAILAGASGTGGGALYMPVLVIFTSSAHA